MASNLATLAQTIADNVGMPYDEVFLERMKYEIISQRATLLRQDFTRNRIIYSQLIQDIGCIELQKTSLDECCTVNLVDMCAVSRTKSKVPTPVRIKENSSPFMYVGGIDKTAPFTWTIPEKLPYMLTRRYGKKNQIYFTYLNGYIYVFHLYHQEAIKKINIRGIWEDPVALAALKNCAGKECAAIDDFPIPRDMHKLIKDLIYAELKAMIPKDTEITIDDDKAQPQ